MTRSVFLIVVALLLIVPGATAHLQGARPILQRVERDRIVDLQPDGTNLRAGLSLVGEPLRHYIVHDLRPSRGEFGLEYRRDASLAETAFDSVWEVGRLLEYRDVNTNGRFDESIDVAAKVWRFTAYTWSQATIQRVQVGEIQTSSAIWTANLSGAPQIRLEVVVAGEDFTDEGVLVRPQDVAIYLDFLDLPNRNVGNLYALEWKVRAPSDAAYSLHRVEGTPTALIAFGEFQSAILLWGGEAVIDGGETRFNASLEGERIDGVNKTARLVLHLPAADDSMRFALVSVLEYGTVSRREPLGLEVVLLAIVLAVALFTGTARREPPTGGRRASRGRR